MYFSVMDCGHGAEGGGVAGRGGGAGRSPQVIFTLADLSHSVAVVPQSPPQTVVRGRLCRDSRQQTAAGRGSEQ